MELSQTTSLETGKEDADSRKLDPTTMGPARSGAGPPDPTKDVASRTTSEPAGPESMTNGRPKQRASATGAASRPTSHQLADPPILAMDPSSLQLDPSSPRGYGCHGVHIEGQQLGGGGEGEKEGWGKVSGKAEGGLAAALLTTRRASGK